MPYQSYIVKLAEILDSAERLGYKPGVATKLLHNDAIMPTDWGRYRHHVIDDLTNKNWSDQTKHILQNFYNEHGLTSFILI